MGNLTSDVNKKTNGMLDENFGKKNQNSDYQFGKLAQEAGEKMGAAMSDLSHSAGDTIKSGRDYVEHNPTKGVAIAAGVGLVVGSLLTMVMRSSK